MVDSHPVVMVVCITVGTDDDKGDLLLATPGVYVLRLGPEHEDAVHVLGVHLRIEDVRLPDMAVVQDENGLRALGRERRLDGLAQQGVVRPPGAPAAGENANA